MAITELTRRNLIDALTLGNVAWWGRLDEVEFLERLYDLDSLPSTDRRCPTALGDIHTHRISFNDWPDEWVFFDQRFGLLDGPDEVLLRFLAEMLHPMVRRDQDQSRKLAATINEHLRADSWELAPVSEISGHPVYAARQLLSGEIPGLDQLQADALDSSSLAQQITRLRSAAASDPALAIGTAKELVESVCRSVLARAGRNVGEDAPLPDLVRAALGTLRLLPEGVPQTHPGARSLRTLYGSLTTACQSLAELRNLFGTGHGRAEDAPGLEARHGHLAASCATAIALFVRASMEGTGTWTQ